MEGMFPWKKKNQLLFLEVGSGRAGECLSSLENMFLKLTGWGKRWRCIILWMEALTVHTTGENFLSYMFIMKTRGGGVQ